MGEDVVIEKLPLEYKKNSLIYKQIKRGEKAVMYLITDPENDNAKVGVEVYVIKVEMNRRFKDIVYPPCEPLPSNTEFGTRAWCFGHYNQVGADKRFQAIESGTFSRDAKDEDLEEEEED